MASGIIGVKSGNNALIPYAATTRQSKEVTLTVTSAQSGWSTTRAVGVFYADSAGVWRLRFNVSGTFTKATITRVQATISNVTFKSTNSQAICGSLATDNLVDLGAYYRASAVASSGTLDFSVASTTNCVGVNWSGNVELDSEPTTYTTAANMEGVVQASVYIPPADASTTGLVTTGAQTLAGLKTFSGGIKLPTTGGTAGTLDYYEEGSFSAYLVDGTNKSSATTMRFVRVGKMVMMYPVDTLTLTNTTTARNLTTTNSASTYTWPATLTPTTTITTTYVAVTANGTTAFGAITIASTGTVTLYPDAWGSAWSSSNVMKGIGNGVISYFLT